MMSLSVQQRREYLISFYVRESEQAAGHETVPEDILTVIIAFYGLWFDLDSLILSDIDDKLLLLDMIEHKVKHQSIGGIKLLYNTDRDGSAYADYQRTCFGKERTLTLIQDGEYMYGGYTSVAWSGTSGFKPDETAFLFCLKCKEKSSRKEWQAFDVIKTKQAVYHFSNTFGPWFGNEDLVVWMQNKEWATVDHLKCEFNDRDSYKCKAADLCPGYCAGVDRTGISMEIFELS